MEFLELSSLSEAFFVVIFIISIIISFLLCFFMTLTYHWWIAPNKKLQKLKKCGFGGPSPIFPLGNIKEMKRKKNSINNNNIVTSSISSSSNLSHDIHSSVSPYYSSWQKSYGKVFIYWLGTEPFLYVADAEFLKKMSNEVLVAKTWGKPSVFRNDRFAMFGNGLVMAESDIWSLHRHVIAPAFSPLKLKAIGRMMVEPIKQMINRWDTKINLGNHEIDVEKEIIATAGEIIARAVFGMRDEKGKLVFEKLRTLQMILFKSNRYVGVPFGKYFAMKKTLEANKLGQEIEKLLLSIIEERVHSGESQDDLLGILLQETRNVDGKLKGVFSMRELVDECKTFFFGGYETTSLSITWSLLLLAMHQDWQNQLRDEIKHVLGANYEDLDINKLADLKKMKCVMNEALRLYPPSPNVQRQAKEDIRVESLTIPKGTNIWIDLVWMHRDTRLWGIDANEFKPQKFMDDPNGGCNHQMGYLPFGFGGRMCVGRNLTFMEYKIVLTLLLSRFCFKLSPGYHHSPAIMLSLRPTYGLPLIVEPL